MSQGFAVSTGSASPIGAAGGDLTGSYPNPTISSTTGSNEFVRKTSPTIVTPTIASFTNATHDHSNAAGGGTIASTSVTGLGTLATQSGTFSGTHSGASSGTNTGDQTITLTGNVTGSGTGSFAATIAALSITYAKLAAALAGVLCSDVGKVLRCPCPASTAQAPSSDVAHWCYLGYRPAGEVVQYVRFGVSILGAGTQAAEVCVATSASAPTGSAISLTKVWADATVDTLIATTGIKGNTVANTTALAADSHVWVGFRCAMTGGGASQPTLHVLQRDWGAGFLAQTAASGVLTAAGPFTATPVTFANSSSSDIRAYLA